MNVVNAHKASDFGPLEPRDRVVIIGKTGSGKSSLAKRLLTGLLKARGFRVVAFDPHDEYSRHGRKSPEVTLGPLRDRCTVDALSLNPELLDADDLSLAAVPRTGRRECADDFERVCELVEQTGDLLFLADELGHYADYCGETVIAAATQWRKLLVPLVLVAQCMTQIPKTARRQASQLYSGRQDDPDDLLAIFKLTHRQSPDFSERVATLGPGELLHWRDTFNAAPNNEKRKAA